MKLPEPLFAIINPVVTLLLRSPIHGFWSRNLMLITFTGRNSGRRFTTPVRYVRDGDTVRCFTSASNQWWRNLRGGAAVCLRLRGEDRAYIATAIADEPDEIRRWLQQYLAQFPQDAAYHDIRLQPDKSPVAADLDAAARTAVVVQAVPRAPEAAMSAT